MLVSLEGLGLCGRSARLCVWLSIYLSVFLSVCWLVCMHARVHVYSSIFVSRQPWLVVRLANIVSTVYRYVCVAVRPQRGAY